MILHQVITTEKVPFNYRVAGIGARFLAWMVDFSICVLLGFVGQMLAGVLEALNPGVGMAFFHIWLFCLFWGYFFLFEWLWLGQTPGKRWVGIRAIQESGIRVSFFQSAVRNLLRMVDGLPPLYVLYVGFYGLAFGVAICDPKHRRLGDWAAGTLVVHVDKKAKPIRAMREANTPTGRMNEAVLRQRLAQLNREQKQTLLDLSLRRDQLRVSDRAQLFRAVADYFRTQFDLAPEEHQSDEKFVLQLAEALGTDGKGQRT